MSQFPKLITSTQLHDLAGDRSYERGSNYFRQGRVQSLVESEDEIRAEVVGTEPYEVALWIEDRQLGYECDCPVGLDGIFCKHCVAVGLAWLAKPTESRAQGGKRSPSTTMQDVQRYLEQQEKPDLVKLILDRAAKDTDWREHLLLKVAALKPQGADLKTFERALKNAITIRGYLEYGEVKRYARGIEKVLDAIANLLSEGQAQAVMELCEYAIPLLETAMNSVDDSNGYVGAILEEVQDLHYRACEQVKPDPITLAERLFEFEMGTGFDTFYGAVDTYADLLGDAGLIRYRQMAEAAWEESIPSSSSRRMSFDSQSWRLSNIMERLARQTGDVEAVVAVKRRDLSQPYSYLNIAQLYLDSGKPESALKWAEDGLKAFPDRTDSRLNDFLIEEYQKQGRFEEAIALTWKMFADRPSLISYQKLKAEAERGKQWAKWREQAIAHIRQQIKQAKKQTTGALAFTYRDHSLLIEILLWEEEVESAWQEAKTGGCTKALWLRLADLRQQAYPEDSLSIYMNQIEPLIQATNNSAYADAVEFLKKARSLMLRLELRSQYDQFVAHLRTTYKAKRNFIGLLNREKL
jgi:uncharacterized Zn finger protein